MNNRQANRPGLNLKKNAIIALFTVNDFIPCIYPVVSTAHETSIEIVRAMLIYVHFDLSYTLALLLNRLTYGVSNLM